MTHPKIALVGAGQIGGTLAMLTALKGLGTVTLIDVAADMATGKALDLAQAGAVAGYGKNIAGTGDYAALAGADVVIVTAGIPRKPGMSRDDLLDINCAIIKTVGEAIKTHAPDAFVIVITNPLDVMVWVLQQSSGLPPHKVVGMAGILDASRFRLFLSQALSVAMDDIHTLVLGGHGDAMVPLLDYTTVQGIPLQYFIDKGTISQSMVDDIVARTRAGGAEIVQLLKNGSAFYAPAVAALEMAQAYLRDEKRLLPCAAYCRGEFGVTDLYAGVPVIIGAGGVEAILDIPLTPDTRAAFEKSVAGVKSLTGIVQERLGTAAK